MSLSIGLKHCPVCKKEYLDGDNCPEDGAALVGHNDRPDPMIGLVLKDTYRIDERVAEGGMGVIYRATQLPLNRRVAVKAILANPLHSNDLVQRFVREAKMLSQVNHPNVVSLIDFGNTDAGVIYMVMEYLHGRTLDKAVPRDRGLAVDTVLDLMEQICAGVGEAHRHQMVHRDLKPSNVFLANVAADGVMVKILDFGIAKALDGNHGPLTHTGAMIGSSGYMSPEQITGSAEIDHRSDIYSLGGILYFMLAGQPAYKGASTRLVLTRQLVEQPEEIDFDQLGKPEAQPLMPVILKAMHPEVEQRYQSVGELLDDLREACGAQERSTTSRRRRHILLREGEKGDNSDEKLSTISSAVAPTHTLARSRPGADAATAVPHGVGYIDSRTRRNLLLGVAATVILLSFIAGLMILQMKQPAPPVARNPVEVKTPAVPDKPRPTATARGVSESEVLFGINAAFTGPSKELGRGMQLGIDTYFNHVNEQGGVAGRKLRLIALDDGYEPPRALTAIKELYEQHKVFAVLGNVGTPTATAALPYALDKQLPYLGAFTGAGLLRKDPPDRFVFNYRASYAEETAAVVRYLVEVRKLKPESIAVFAQNDPYGDAGFQGVVKAVRKYGKTKEDILRVGYERNTVKIEGAVEEILKNRDKVRAVVMVPTYLPAAKFVRAMRDNKLNVICTSVSFVGSEALAEEFRQSGPEYGEGVIVTQVVPHYESGAAAVIKYRELLKKYHPNEAPGFVSLEGYIASSVFVEGLRKAGEELTNDSYLNALESIRDLDLGIGTKVNFGPSEHQGSHKVWGTVLDKAAHYQILDLD
jgi:serine/threonine protein kinase/ABC-type branched-subunit amino acid transport system substrate-binding protein